MNLSGYLLRKNLSLAQILHEARSAVALQSGDILFVSGSLMEGIGNEKSDIDLFLITPRTDFEYNACLTDITLVIGECLIDIRVINHSHLKTLLERFQVWSEQPRAPRRAFEFVEDERKLLYRLKIGQALFGEFELKALQDQISMRDLSRHKLDWARHLASAIQVDLAGFRDQNDCYSMLFSAQDLLGHCMDAILAAAGFANPNTKWRSRYLSTLDETVLPTLPGNYHYQNMVDLFIDLHRIPVKITSQNVHDFALKITCFSRAAFPWAERTLLAPHNSLFNGSLPLCEPTGLPFARALEHLDLDVEITYRNGSFEVGRLNEAGSSVSLSDDAYRCICLFDGKTQRQAAVAGRVALEDMENLIRFARLGARPMVDESFLGTLLQCDGVPS